MVKKASGKWQMCVDFTDLNKACPKDSYELSDLSCCTCTQIDSLYQVMGLKRWTADLLINGDAGGGD